MFHRTKYLLSTTLLGALMSALGHAQPVDAPQAELVVQTESRFVHAVPLDPGFTFLHTNPRTAVMKPIFRVEPLTREQYIGTLLRRRGAAQLRGDATGEELQDVDDRIAKRFAYNGFDQRVIGVTHDDQRLYVLVGGQTFVPGRGLVNLRAAPNLAVRNRYMLHVFWLESGSLIHSQEISYQPFGRLPEETMGAGPLSANNNVISVFGNHLEFNGENLSSVEDDGGRRLTLPDGFGPFDERPRSL